MAPRKITARLYTESNVLVGTLTYDAAQFDRRMNDTGMMSLSIPDKASYFAGCTYGRYIRFYEDGVVKMTALIEEIDRKIVGQTPSQRGKVLRGRGWIAEWDWAKVKPVNGMNALPSPEMIYYNYSHPRFDRSSWIPVTELEPTHLAAYYGGVPTFRTPPSGWTDLFTRWVWSREFESAGPWLGSHAPGTSYFALPFTAPVTAPATILVTADNLGAWWLDNELRLETDDWRVGYSIGTLLTAGPHLLICRAVNADAGVYSGSGYVGNPGGITCVGYQQIVNPYLIPENVIFRSNVSGMTCLDYPDPAPGWTAGAAITDLWEVEIANGGLTGWTLGFDETIDSSGAAWPTLPELSAKVGDSYLVTLQQWAELGLIDFQARPGTRVLDAWVGGTQGNFHTAPGTRPIFSPVAADGESNVAEITVKGRM